MKVRKAAANALALLPADARSAGERLVAEDGLVSWSVRVREDQDTFSVACEQEGTTLRAACTCGSPECPHVAAVLTALSVTDETPIDALASSGEIDVPRPPPAPPSPPLAPVEKRDEGADGRDLADALDALVRETCTHGLEGNSVERDDALDRVLASLKDRDMPDLRRAVAMLRRELTSPVPDPGPAGTALIRLTHEAEALRTLRRRGRTLGPIGLTEGSERREEVRLLEVARDTQRTPYGDRRDVSYFIDIEDGHLYRELAAAKPGSPPRMSEGPFPKLLVGNLVAIEAGPEPRRIRMLQYSTAGLLSGVELDRIRSAATTSVAALYDTYRKALETHDATLDPVVVFAPTKTLPSPKGTVLLDAANRVLPLARSVEPAQCEAVDLLARNAKIVAVVGPLVLAPTFLSIFPLAVLVGQGEDLSLRQMR